MNIFLQIKNSVYGPAFYAGEAQASGGRAFGYFTKLIAMASLVCVIILSFTLVPGITSMFSASTINAVVSEIPADLKVTVKGGQLSTNGHEPIAIPLPASWQPAPGKSATSSPSVKNLLVIDTQAVFTEQAFDAYSTDILVTKDFIIARKQDGTFTLDSLKSAPDTVIDRGQLQTWIGKVRPYLAFLTPLLLLGFLIGVFVVEMVMNLVYILLATIIAWIVQKIRRRQTGFGTCYKLGLHAITPVILLDVLLLILVGVFSVPWYIGLVVFLVCFFANARKLA